MSADALTFSPGEVTRNFLIRKGDWVEPVGFSHFPVLRRSARSLYPELDSLDDAPAYEIKEGALICGGPHGGSYWHWLIDYLPRLAAYDGLKAPLIVNTNRAGFQDQSLDLYAPGRVVIGKPERYRLICETLYAAPFYKGTGVVTPEIVSFLRRILPGIPKDGPRKVYLSRRGVANRALKNEADIESRLEDEGFEIVLPHKLRFEEQVRMVANAETVIAPHGAAMANLAFCPKGAKFIEIETKPGHRAGPSICEAAGLEYEAVKDIG